jgi:xylan 1,4-beta-xylosidase
VEIDFERLYFGYRIEGVDQEWGWLPELFDASILSDVVTAPRLPNFTDTFIGMACQDLAGTGRPADFDFLEDRERNDRENPFSL